MLRKQSGKARQGSIDDGSGDGFGWRSTSTCAVHMRGHLL
jgi:hypothetical protein